MTTTTYDYSWQAALLMGLTLALSSTALVMQLLHERGDLATRHGTASAISGMWNS